MRFNTTPFLSSLCFSIMIQMASFNVNAEIYTCIENGKRILKSYDSCEGEIAEIRPSQNNYNPRREVQKAEQHNTQIPSNPQQTLEDLKKRCPQDFKSLVTKGPRDSRTRAINTVLLKNRCESKTVECFNLFDELINNRGRDTVTSRWRKGSALRAMCGLPEEPMPEEVSRSIQESRKTPMNCRSDGIGGMTCR